MNKIIERDKVMELVWAKLGEKYTCKALFEWFRKSKVARAYNIAPHNWVVEIGLAKKIKLKENQFYEIKDGRKQLITIDRATGEKQLTICYTPDEYDLICEVKVDLYNKVVTITEYKNIDKLNPELYEKGSDFKYS